MFSFCNGDSVCFLFVSLLAAWVACMGFLGLYTLVSNMITKHFYKGVAMGMELKNRIAIQESELTAARYEDDGSMDAAFFIDDLWEELNDLKEVKGAYDD